MLIAVWMVFGAVVLWLFMVAPNVIKPKHDFSALVGHMYAHRGLHDDKIPENSLTAFDRAAQMGYGIELDVHLSADGEAVVFHDDTLVRMCRVDARIEDKPLAALKTLSLNGTGEKIPTLHETLALVDARVPLIIELKGLNRKICRVVDGILSAYRGAYCVESFNPLLIYWYRRHRPDVVRGQLTGNLRPKAGAKRATRLSMFLIRNLLVNCLSRPDFIADELGADKRFAARLQRIAFSPLFAAWTLRGEEGLKDIKARYQLLIFEGFCPKVNQQPSN